MSASKDLPATGRTSPPQRVESQQTNADIAGFEASLEELESLIDRLESGDLSLDEGLKTFERGVALARSCQQTLKIAEQRVMTLIGDSDESAPVAASAPADETRSS